MKYFVVFPDGQKFGPADVNTLNTWIAEGRVTPTTELESADTGARLSAGSVPGLMFTAAAPGMVQPSAQAPSQPYQPTATQSTYDYNAPQGQSPYGNAPAAGSNYPRSFSGDDGSKDVTTGWILVILGFCCCLPINFVGIYYGYRAKQKGNQSGQTVMIVGIILAVLSIAMNVFFLLTGTFTSTFGS